MQSPILSRIPRGVLFALAALLLLPLSAPSVQAQPSDAEREAFMAQRAERIVERLTDELSLTTRQADLIEQTLTARHEAGALWTLAAELTPTLSDAQKATLFAPPERPERDERRERAERTDGERAERAGRRGARTDGPAGVDLEEDRRARNEALGLSSEQAEQLGALGEQRRAARQERMEQQRAERGERGARPEPGQLPDELAEVLTPAQQEIAQVHQALLMRMRLHGPRQGHRFGRRAGGPGQGR